MKIKSKIAFWVFSGILIVVFLLIGVPYINKILDESRKGATRGNLSAIRAAVSIYYSENEGNWPGNLEVLIPKYLDNIPEEPISKSNKVVAKFDGTGGWYYKSNPNELEIGNVYPNLNKVIK